MHVEKPPPGGFLDGVGIDCARRPRRPTKPALPRLQAAPALELRRSHARVPCGAQGPFRFGGLAAWALRRRVGLDVLRQLALRPGGNLEIDARALLEGLEALHGDGGEMREHVRASSVRLDEAET